MKYNTNNPEFDFPTWNGRPKIFYIVLSTPRSGSNMLVRSLWQSGVAGAPEEYLAPAFIEDFCERFSDSQPNLASEVVWREGNLVLHKQLADYLKNIVSIRTSPNGVFGVKIHASHFFLEHLRMIDLVREIPADRIIRIRRRDYVRQAISLIMAQETDQWIDDPEWGSVRKPPKRDPSEVQYSSARIDDCITYLEALDDFLDEIILRWEKPYKEVVYEELCESFTSTMLNVIDFIGASPVNEIRPVNIRQQFDENKNEWFRRYNVGKAP